MFNRAIKDLLDRKIFKNYTQCAKALLQAFLLIVLLFYSSFCKVVFFL